MTLKNFDIPSDYIQYANGEIIRLENHPGAYDGYFQNHAIGLVLFAFGDVPYLKIGDKEYDVASIKKAAYSASGSQRKVHFLSRENNVIETFNYAVFWDSEADLLEFAMELPDDVQRDLMKFVSNKISADIAYGKARIPFGHCQYHSKSYLI